MFAHQISTQPLVLAAAATVLCVGSSLGGEFVLQLRSQSESSLGSGKFERASREETWDARTTALIVCDVWDYHHCLNAVRRLEEFAPRMNQVLAEARRRGATIIHSPSDCMDSYADHAARQRALTVLKSAKSPRDIESWCSRIPSEEKAVYPIDQSDGGEDDDPAEHAEWAKKLKSLGRNPGMPWKAQSKLIEIDADRDFISDRGDEVWNILDQRAIKNVILVGVHNNMCVLGRPFGLRQMARNGKHVVLMRDMTDCMYNPQRWPYVNHFTGNDLIVSHVERFVCPTITSDQILGGQPFQSKFDTRPQHDLVSASNSTQADRTTFEKHWSLISLPSAWDIASAGVLTDYKGAAWYRCSVRLPQSWKNKDGLSLSLSPHADQARAWLNGHALIADTTASTKSVTLQASSDWIVSDDANLLVVRLEHRGGDHLRDAPILTNGKQTLPLKGRWQFRLGNDEAWSNIPLPARFGTSPDILFEP